MRIVLLLTILAIGPPAFGEDEIGEKVYMRWCTGCHDTEIAMNAGTRRLAIRSGEEQSALTDRDDLPSLYIKSVVRNGIMMMPPFRQSEISDDELEALARFLAADGSEGAEE